MANLSFASIAFSERYFECWTGRIGEKVTNVSLTSQFCYTSLLIKRNSDAFFFNRGPKRLSDSNGELHSKQDITTPSGQTFSGRSRIRLCLRFLTLGSEMLEERCGVKLIFHFRIHTDIDTTETHKTVPHLWEESWQSHLSREKQHNFKNGGHGGLLCDMFSVVKKTLACCTNL
jgi:hypothetical protein